MNIKNLDGLKEFAHDCAEKASHLSPSFAGVVRDFRFIAETIEALQNKRYPLVTNVEEDPDAQPMSEREQAQILYGSGLASLKGVSEFALGCTAHFSREESAGVVARLMLLAISDAISKHMEGFVPKAVLEANEIGYKQALAFESFQHAGTQLKLTRVELNSATTRLDYAGIMYRYREFLSQRNPAMQFANENPAIRPNLINAVNWLVTGKMPGQQ